MLGAVQSRTKGFANNTRNPYKIALIALRSTNTTDFAVAEFKKEKSNM